MITIGIICGLWAAFFQALSYFATRHYVNPRGGGSRELLVMSHVWMGLASAVGLIFTWPATAPAWGTIIAPLLLCSGFYALGQMGLMLALKHAQPSQVSPMLALKLLILGGMSITIAHQPLGAGQWIALLLCLAGTFLANYEPGKKLAFLPIVIVVFTCLFYAFSDWNIGRLNNAIAAGAPLTPRMLAFASSAAYAVCGVAGALLLPLYGSRSRRDWIDAAPFAASWFLGMLGLYACFGFLGVLYGNVLQSTRAIISVGLAALFVKMGWDHLERTASRGAFLRRLVAACLVVAAVILYHRSHH